MTPHSAKECTFCRHSRVLQTKLQIWNYIRPKFDFNKTTFEQ